jgi:hypothetical protein
MDALLEFIKQFQVSMEDEDSSKLCTEAATFDVSVRELHVLEEAYFVEHEAQKVAKARAQQQAEAQRRKQARQARRKTVVSGLRTKAKSKPTQATERGWQ